MFCKLHRQMTIFSTLVTSGILILMTITCLIISEQGLVRNSYERFWNNGNSCVAYLESQKRSQNMLETAARISKEEQGLDVEYSGNLALSREIFFKSSTFWIK